jgi:hypothetical protein
MTEDQFAKLALFDLLIAGFSREYQLRSRIEALETQAALVKEPPAIPDNPAPQ